MRIADITVKDVPPIRHFAVSRLSDLAVIAGPNGVGKTRLIEEVRTHIRSPSPNERISLAIQATSDSERSLWDRDLLTTDNHEDCTRLATSIPRNAQSRPLQSSIIMIESGRLVTYRLPWDHYSRSELRTSLDREPSTLQERFQHTLLLIAEWAELQQKADAERVATARRKGETVVAVDPTDRLEPFKRAFQQLLSPKRLIDPDPQSQTLQFDLDGKPFPLDALSSGEKECVNIIFDFVAYSPADCIILFDEPELHLHPELSYNLINTLRTQGTRNQIVLCTHSSHIITSSLQHTVVFMAPPEKRDGNQAILVEEDDETHEALMLLGQSIGVISLGRKIVLIEGGHSSIDKYVYYNVVKEKRPEFVLVPCESKHIVSSFSAINRKVLTNTLWGIDFFMICDKDAVPYGESVIDLEERSRGRLKLLPRYHIENYFLDEGVLVGVFSAFESEDSWLRSEDAISTKLRAIAKERLSYAVALVVAAELRRKVGNLDLMPRRCHHLEIDKLVAVIMDKVAEEKGRIDELLNAKHVESIAHGVYRQLESSLDNGDEWKAVIPGREIFRIFANATRMDVNRLTRAYINEASNHAPYPFQDILDIFDHFAGLDRTVGSA